jgi:hypothetical protein
MRECYGTLFSSPFTTTDEIEVPLVIQDGTDTSKPTADFTSEDREALSRLGVDLDLELNDALGVKLTGAEINAYLDKLYGFTLTDEELQERVVKQSLLSGWGEWYYDDATDTYYHFSNGTANQIVTCTFGLRRTNGHVILSCKNVWSTQGQSWQVELVPNGDGYQFAAIIPVTGEERLEGDDLTKEELNQAAQWLSQPGVCELFWDGFDDWDDADLSAMLYDGGGLEMSQLEPEELAALEEAAGEAELDVVKLTTAQIDQILQSRLGLSPGYYTLHELQARLLDSGWYYLEDYDAFYHIHGDTMRLTISCQSGVRVTGNSWNGLWEVECYSDELGEGTYLALLCPTEDGFELLRIREVS